MVGVGDVWVQCWGGVGWGGVVVGCKAGNAKLSRRTREIVRGG